MKAVLHPAVFIQGGQAYSYRYLVHGPYIEIFHAQLTRKATPMGIPVASFAESMMFGLVVREGLGVPDGPAPA